MGGWPSKPGNGPRAQRPKPVPGIDRGELLLGSVEFVLDVTGRVGVTSWPVRWAGRLAGVLVVLRSVLLSCLGLLVVDGHRGHGAGAVGPGLAARLHVIVGA